MKHAYSTESVNAVINIQQGLGEIWFREDNLSM